MNTYDKCRGIRRYILNRAAEVMAYTNWDGEFALKQIRDIPREVLEEHNFGMVNIAELTAEQMDNLDFGRWSEDNPMRLIPLWLLPFLPDEIEADCIDGVRTVYKRSEMNNDNRGGYLAYGIRPAAAVTHA